MTKHAVLFPARSVPCPACYARAGEPCKLSNGKTTSTAHAARVKAYRKAFKGPRFVGDK